MELQLNRATRRAMQQAQRKPTGKEPRKPKGLLYDPMTYVTDGINPSPDSLLANLRTIELGSIDAFARGAAQAMDFYNLVALHDVAWQMAVRGIGVEVESICATAMEHLIDTAKRQASTGRWGATGPALQAWRELYRYHDLQRTSVSRGQYEQMVRLAIEERKRVDRGVRR